MSRIATPRRIVLLAGWVMLILLLFAAPALAFGTIASSTADTAIAAGAVLGAGALGVGGTLLGGNLTSGSAAQAADVAQLRAVRQEAANDIRDVADSGAELEKAVTLLLASAGTSAETRTDVLARTSELETRLEFIWDAPFRESMKEFVRLTRAAATTDQVGELRARAVEADEAWQAAKVRASAVWRALMESVLQVAEVLPAGLLPAGQESGTKQLAA
jgi:hypothetical protein